MLGFILGVYRFFSSLKAAVGVLSVLGVGLAVGTFYESAYGREAAGEVIYKSWWMTATLFFLALNIAAVMVDRWPWRKRHIPFLMAHIGILMVLTGSSLTRFYGVDGSVRLQLQETSRQLLTSNINLVVYSSFDGLNLTELYRQRVHFYRSPPRPDAPYLVPLGPDNMKILQFVPAATARSHFTAARFGGSAIHFHIRGTQADVTKWLFKPLWQKQVLWDMGPAEVWLSESFPPDREESGRGSEKKTIPFKGQKPALFLSPKGDRLQYHLYHPSKGMHQTGETKPGGVLKTGWMDFEFRLISYLPQALPHTLFTPQPQVSPGSVPAIEVAFKGESRHLGLNSHLFFFDEDKVYIVAYTNERKYLGFELTLQDFKITRYPSSRKAKAYESRVLVNGQTSHPISMNQPLKLKGYTLYQAGFEEKADGTPLASILSVNKDPGRWWKYMGALAVVVGAGLLFAKRSRKSRKNRKTPY